MPNRPARALIGWMPEAEAILALNARRAGIPPTEEQLAKIQSARTAVAGRTEHDAQGDVVLPIPPELAPLVEALHVNPAGASLFAIGGEVHLINLDRVVAFQPLVHLDNAVERIAGAGAGDWADLAAVTLPLVSSVELPASYDEARKAWIIVSPSPNIRAGQQFSGNVQLPSGAAGIGFGFTINAGVSMLQIGLFQGRYFLRDGYHRALGLLQRGISQVPGFVTTVDQVEQLAPPGMLPQSAYLGPHPPRLADYLDETVAVEVQAPATAHMIVIQGLEFDFVS
jgi:hypothetical protein